MSKVKWNEKCLKRVIEKNILEYDELGVYVYINKHSITDNYGCINYFDIQQDLQIDEVTLNEILNKLKTKGLFTEIINDVEHSDESYLYYYLTLPKSLLLFNGFFDRYVHKIKEEKILNEPF